MHFNHPFKRFVDRARIMGILFVHEFISFAQQQPGGIQMIQPDKGREFQPVSSWRLAVGWFSHSPPCTGIAVSLQ